jgi:hypothetical protein
MESGVTKLFLFCFVICIIASEQSSIILSAHVPACIDSALWTMGVCSYWEHVNSQSTHWICLKKLPLVAALPSWYAENFTPNDPSCTSLASLDKSIFSSSGFVYVKSQFQCKLYPKQILMHFDNLQMLHIVRLHVYLFLSFWSFGLYEDRTSLCCHQIL